MKIRLVEPVHIQTGDKYNTQSESCCCIPGSPGYTSVYFGVDMYVDVAVTDERQVWMSLGGGDAAHLNNRLTKGSGAWQVYWGISSRMFTITSVEQLPAGGHYIADMWAEPDPGSSANAGINFPDATDVHVGDTSFPDGWYLLGNIDDLETDHKTYFNFYIAFPVKNTNGQTDFKEIPAFQIHVDDPWVPVIFEYFPWGRKIDGEWWSHNRDGGRLSRYNSGWQDVKNIEGNTGESKGFRFNGSDWAVSPRTGREE